MNKDALLATLIGFGIGLLITGVLLLGPNLLKYLPSIKLPAIALSLPQGKGALPTPTPTPAATLTIDSPLADTIEPSTDLLVSGSVIPGSTVVVAGPNDESVVAAGADGKYAGKITLTEGKNDVIVTSYKDGKQYTQTVTVYYTQASL